MITHNGKQARLAEDLRRGTKQAGLSKIDYLVTTHYHADHVGGAAELAKLISRTYQARK